ncbi:hypothetical protein [Burkholderia phage BCSR129]|nr:hypothetical protein [Burkholderia phage BCSR129]
MTKSVNWHWNNYRPLTLTDSEAEALTSDLRSHQIVWRTRGQILHTATANEWAFKRVAGMRGEEFRSA